MHILKSMDNILFVGYSMPIFIGEANAMKKIIFLVLVCFLFAASAWAAKTTYVATNHRFNYVKIKEVSGKIAEARQMTHPATVDEQGLREALASIKLSRSYLIKKEVDTQQVFEESDINFLAPNLVKAFAQATALEEVVFSYLSKNPIFILRNDRINIAKAWIHDNELHVKFEKLYAKIIGDVDKRGNEAKAISKAQGLRINLELGEGQKYGIDDHEEIVLDMHRSYAKPPEPEKKQTEATTMAGEKIPFEQQEAKATSPSDKKLKNAKKSADTAPPPPPAPTVEERLKKLEELKKSGLINKKEFEEKKKEILKEL